MKEILDDFMTEDEGVPEFPYDPNIVNSNNFWWKILTNPTDAFGFVLYKQLLNSTLLLFFLTTSISFFESSELDQLLPSLSFFYENEVTRIIFELCFVSIVGLIFIAMLYFIGKILGGKGAFLDVGISYVWSSVPSLIGLPIVLYMFFAASPGDQPLLQYLNTLLNMWGLILSFKGLAIAHQFSARKSVYTYLLLICVIIGIGIFSAMLLDHF